MSLLFQSLISKMHWWFWYYPNLNDTFITIICTFYWFDKKCIHMPSIDGSDQFPKINLFIYCFIFGENRVECFCRDWSPHKNNEFAKVVHMWEHETNNQPKAETGDNYQGVTYYVNHGLFLRILCLPAKFINDRNYRSGIETLFGDYHESFLIVHGKDLVPEDCTDRKGQNSDSYVNQQICEHLSHTTSHFLLRCQPDKYIEYIWTWRNHEKNYSDTLQLIINYDNRVMINQ